MLTGGDPLERPDLIDLITCGTEYGLSMALSPSVTPRLTRDALGQLTDAGIKAVSISVDGAGAATHDAFRQVPGVFDATMRALADVRDAGARLQINTTVTADTAHELPRILALALAARASLWSVFFLVPTGRGTRLRPLSPADEEDVLHWLYDAAQYIAIKTTEAPQYRRIAIQRAQGAPPVIGELGLRLRALTAEVLGDPGVIRPRRPPIDVNSGRGFVFIDHRGTVYPSGFMPVSVGSVHQQPLTDIYRDAPLLRQLRTPADFHGKCGVCEFRDVCGGSRSRAYAASGDALGEDPSCVYIPPGMTAERAFTT